MNARVLRAVGALTLTAGILVAPQVRAGADDAAPAPAATCHGQPETTTVSATNLLLPPAISSAVEALSKGQSDTGALRFPIEAHPADLARSTSATDETLMVTAPSAPSAPSAPHGLQ